MTPTECARPACDRKPIRGARGYCRKHAYAEGALTPFVDAAPTRRIFHQAQQDGHSIATISRATGVSHGTVSRVLNGESKRVRQITEDRAHRFIGHTNLTPCWPLTRRVRSLLAAGHSMAQIARGCGVARETISHIVHAEHKNVRWRVGEAVRAYWEQHCADPVGAPHPLAVKHGWNVPMIWDDIDDPDEERRRRRRWSA